MNRLIEDVFTRRIAQVLVLSVFGLLALVPVLLLAIILLQALGQLVGFWQNFAVFLLRGVSLPLGDTAAQVATVFITTFPVAVATVCFVTSPIAVPPAASETMNVVGRSSVILLLAGALASLLTLILFSTNLALITTINRDEAQSLLVRGVVGGILSFQVLYLTRLLGLETKK